MSALPLFSNAIGAYAGPYSIYRALAIAMGDLAPDHKPNFDNTQPVIDIQQQPQWSDPSKIISMDPFGHLTTELFKKEIEEGLDIRPTISITRAHMIVPELLAQIQSGELPVDGEVVINNLGEINVHKAAVDPVWYLPGVAARLKVGEGYLRRMLFEHSGGMYPELITRPDVKVFLPPIGGLTVYIFGNHKAISDPNTRLTVRVHDECNGSDVFGSDICTCRPYLIFGMEASVREAQNGGVGLIIYCMWKHLLHLCLSPNHLFENSFFFFCTNRSLRVVAHLVRKEGRALGEVTKYLVYNARKRIGDTAAQYFTRTEDVAGVKVLLDRCSRPSVENTPDAPLFTTILSFFKTRTCGSRP